MKKILLIALLITLIIPSIFTQTFRSRPQTALSNAPLELLHDMASGYKNVQYSEPGPNRNRNSTGTKKIMVGIPERVEALNEIAIRKDVSSIPAVCFAATDGLSTRYSRTGLPGNRENLPPQLMTKVRLTALQTLMNFTTPAAEAQKNMIKEALKTSFFEEWDERVRSTSCAAIAIHKDAFSDAEKDFLNENFRREVMRIIAANQFRLLSSMYRVADVFGRKSGISFLNQVLISGVRGKYYLMALQLRQKLTVYGK